MLPRIIIHNAVSADGRINDFEPDIGLYYELAMSWKEDATLAGSNTIFDPDEDMPKETKKDFEKPEVDPKDKRPILVVPDSRGRVRNWHYLRQSGYWRDFVALVSKSTSKKYLDYLKKRHINYIVTGTKKVNLKNALEKLNQQYGVKKVRVDSGGTLNGVLLQAGLVDEVSLLIHPALVGSTSPGSIFHVQTQKSQKGPITLKIKHIEKYKGGLIWIRYDVIKKNKKGPRRI